MPPVEEQTAVDVVRSGLGDDVDDASRCTTVLCVRTGRDHLEFLDGIERDIDRRSLSTCLLTEESVVIIAAVETDVIEYPALAGKVYLVAVRSLRDTNAWREGEKVFELAAQDGSVFYGCLVN